MFYSGAKEAFSAEGWRYGEECPRCSVAGAWSSVGALGCWRSDGAVLAIFQQLEIGGGYIGTMYMDYCHWGQI